MEEKPKESPVKKRKVESPRQAARSKKAKQNDNVEGSSRENGIVVDSDDEAPAASGGQEKESKSMEVDDKKDEDAVVMTREKVADKPAGVRCLAQFLAGNQCLSEVASGGVEIGGRLQAWIW